MLATRRALGLLSTLGLFVPATAAWPAIVIDPRDGILAVALVAAVLWLACAILSARDLSRLEVLERVLLGFGLLTLLVLLISDLTLNPPYQTDEAAFVHQAALLLVHGRDPYGANLGASLHTYGVPLVDWTYTMDGGHVSTLGYPALPVLLTLPIVALRSSAEAAVIVELVALSVAMVMMFRGLPRDLRSLAVLTCVALPALPVLADIGLTAMTLLPALVLLAARWREVGAGGILRTSGRLRAFMLGLALATNQLAWFLAPFLILGMLRIRQSELGSQRAVGVTGRYVAIAGATFLGVNLPFVVWGPSAWLSGVLAPVTQHALPFGQGLVGLSASLGIGGGAVDSYSYGALALYAAMLAIYLLDFERLNRLCFLLPALVLWTSGRSLAEYLEILAVVTLVSVASPGRRAPAEAGRTWWNLAPSIRRHGLRAALLAPALAAFAYALVSPAPLRMRIVSTRPDLADRVASLRVLVRNGSDQPLRPHFEINVAGQATPFWRVRRGPEVLLAGSSATYLLSAPDSASMPPRMTHFVLQAVTGTPHTISSSPPLNPSVRRPGSQS